MNLAIPRGMSRRHFLTHLAAGGAAGSAMEFIAHVSARADEVRKNQKACILIWLGGGPPSIDMWDLKPGSKNGGEFKPIDTAGEMQISEHLPKTALVMDSLALVRTMSTREADHNRGRYYMQTCYVPNPTVVHPVFGSVVSFELGSKRTGLEIPAFVAVGGSDGSPGFLGMTHAPFVVGSDGRIRDSDRKGDDPDRLDQRLSMLAVLEKNFIDSKRGGLPQAHKEVYANAVNLMTSKQMDAFRIEKEPPEAREQYGNTEFGRGLLMARRLVEVGVPFVEVDLNGWDLHQNVFTSLRDRLLPTLDTGLAALTADLKQRGLLDHTTIVCMGEFGRTPRINARVGRDHWASSWTAVIGGGGLKTGQAIGATDADGVETQGKTYLPGDIWATVAHSLGISLATVHVSKRGRPMKIANGGTPIQELIG
ncbi:MAG: DUF1501 domain-containing protein [Planctomycetaceae bacterium]